VSASVFVRHNIEVAHRLTQLPGKCERIHGHGMWIKLELVGQVGPDGLIRPHGADQPLDFGTVKKAFRAYLDERYDHHLLLNRHDPLTALDLPGAVVCLGDPTTENIARWVAEWAVKTFVMPTQVTVDETCTNGATCELSPGQR